MTIIADAIARLAAALGGGPVADLAAAALIEADALGQPRFGIAMLDEWTGTDQPLLVSGQRLASGQGLASCQGGALGWLDCGGSFAPLAVAAATIDLVAPARHHGVAALFLRGVRGFGRLAPFVRYLADAGLVAIAGAEGPPFVAPHGGTRAVIGTNPLAFAMGQGEARVVIDMASASATMAEIRTARAAGTALNPGIALDGAGRPTTIADEVAALLPRDGQVGSLLGLIVELLAGVAGQGRGDAKGRGVFLLALDPAAAGGSDAWAEKLFALKGDWTNGGGHWPRGGGIDAEAGLDDAFSQRLDAALHRLARKE